VNPIQKALDEVKFSIPKAVLELAFKPTGHFGWNRQPISMDERILQAVVRPRVLIDCNLVGGTEAIISLEGLEQDRTEDYSTVYRIPKNRTQGRSILSVMNVTYTSPDALNYGASGGSSQGGSTLLRLGQSMMDAHGSIPNISTAKVQLIGENIVMVKEALLMPGYCYLRCLLANDENMGHIQLRSYHHFCQLVMHAVKAFIYVETVIDLDMGALVGGQQLGAIKIEIDKFADSNENYLTYLREKWTKVAMMNDVETHRKRIQRMIGGAR
jgi:hypothetical protein